MRHVQWVAAAAAAIAVPACAANLAGLLATKPVFEVETTRKLYDVERCAIAKDGPVMSTVYRQPDRPDEEMIVWDGGSGTLGGVAAAARLQGVDGVKLTFWGREKMLRRIKPCVGLTDPG